MKIENKYAIFEIKGKNFKFRRDYLEKRQDVLEWLSMLEKQTIKLTDCNKNK